MKIFYSHYLASDEHPAARMVASISKALEKLGHEVKIHRSAPREPMIPKTAMGTGTKPKGGLVQSLKNGIWFLKALSRNRKYYPNDFKAVEQFQPDIILSRQDAYCYSVAQVARQTGIPMVTYADAPVAYEVRHFESTNRWNPPGLVERIERFQLTSGKAIITISQGSARILERYRLKVPIHVVPNGVDPPRGPLPDGQEKSVRREQWGIKGKRLIGFAGSFKAFHGLDLLARLMESTSHREDTQWLLIGDGPGLDRFREMGSGWKYPPKITGWIQTSQVQDLLELVDVAVAPHARTHGEFYFCPLKLLDYAKAGCAILGSDQGDVPGLLGGDQGGAWVDQDATEIWAAKLKDLLDHPVKSQIMGEIARSKVIHGLTWDHTASQIDKILKTIAS